MRSYQLVATEKIALLDVPAPEPGPHDVLVRVKACGICSRTDLVYYRYLGIKSRIGKGHFGHEPSGVIEKVGEAVQGWAPGDRVFLRTASAPGGFSDYTLARPVHIGRLPDHMSFVEGAPAQQVPIAVNATRNVRAGDYVVIFGQGSAGLQLTQMCRLRGAAKIVTADLYESRCQLSLRLGADVAVKVPDQDIERAVRDAFAGRQPDVVIDAVGIPSVARKCVDLVRSEGTVVIFGTHHVEEEVTFSLVQWESKALTIHMANEGSDETYARAMRLAERLLAERRIETAPYITHVFPPERLPEAIALLEKSPLLYTEAEAARITFPPKQAIKIVIDMEK
jgi:L-idonate 5-dehydrogenase